MSSTRVAAVDCGTNTLRLLIAEDRGGEWGSLLRQTEVARLGQGVDTTQQLHVDALARAEKILSEYAEQLRKYRVNTLRCVATSALRDVTNRAVFEELVRSILGVTPHIISGEEEARLTYTGAMCDLSSQGVEPPYLVIDVGGGSTELVTGGEALSIDVGAVRLTERCVTQDPITPGDLWQLEKTAAQLLREGRVEQLAVTVDAPRIIAVAGSAVTLATLTHRITEYTPMCTHGVRVTRRDVQQWIERLSFLSVADRRMLPGMDPRRADILLAGAVILDTALGLFDAEEYIVSERDILDGVVASLL